MNIPIDIVLAVFAIVVSLLAAGFSYIGGRDLAKRQNSFELRLYILTILDPAKGKITQFISDMNRQINAIEIGDALAQRLPSISAQAESSQARMDVLAKLDRKVVDTYNAISHHLYPDDKTEIETARMDLETPLYDALQSANVDWLVVKSIKENTFHYAEKVLQAIERRLKNTLAFDVPD